MAEVQKVIVQIEADTDAAKAEVNSFRKAIEDGIGDALKEAGVEADKFEQGLKELSKTGSEGFKSLRTQIKEAKTEAQGLAQKFGETSKEALNAQKKVAMLTEEMNDFNDRVKALNPEAKFTAAANSIQGMIGAVQGVTGALQLFGGESEQVEKIAQKLQGALNLAQGINSVMGLKDAFANLKVSLGLATVAQEAMTTAEVAGTTATRGLTAALLSNPLTAVVVAVTALAAGYLLLSDNTEEAADQQGEYNEQLKDANKLMQEAIDKQNALNGIFVANQRGTLGTEAVIERIKNGTDLITISTKELGDALSALKDEYDDLSPDKIVLFDPNGTKTQEDLTRAYREQKKELEDLIRKIEGVISARKKETNEKKKSNEEDEKTIKLLKKIGIATAALSKEKEKPFKDLKMMVEEINESLSKLGDNVEGVIQGLKSTDIPPVEVDVKVKLSDEEKQRIVDEIFNLGQQFVSIMQRFNEIEAQNKIASQDKMLRAGKISQEKYEKEVARIKRKQAEDDRQLAIYQTLINTAVAIMQTIRTFGMPAAIPFIAATAALGAAQIVAINDAPLPRYKKGTLNVGGGNLDADGGQHAIIHKGEAIIPKDRNVAYHPAIAAIYHKRISPREINSFVEAKLRGGKPSQVTAKINATDLYGLKAPDSVSIKNTNTLARQFAKEVVRLKDLRMS